MKKTVLGLLFVALMVCGCANTNHIAFSQLSPSSENEQFIYYNFTASADAVYPENNVKAEETRMSWLNK